MSDFIFQTEQQLDCALDLMRRLPPQQIEKNLTDLIDLVSKFSNCISVNMYVYIYKHGHLVKNLGHVGDV